VASKQACETTAVPAVLQLQQFVITGEIGPDALVWVSLPDWEVDQVQTSNMTAITEVRSTSARLLAGCGTPW